MLSVQHMSDLTTIYLHSPEIEHFDYERAFTMWATTKERRTFHMLSKNPINWTFSIIKMNTVHFMLCYSYFIVKIIKSIHVSW